MRCQQRHDSPSIELYFPLGARVRSKPCNPGVGGQRPRLDEFRVHALRKNAAGDFGRHALFQKVRVQLDGLVAVLTDLERRLFGAADLAHLAALLGVGVPLPQIPGRRAPHFGDGIHVAARNFVAGQPDLVPKPLSSHKDRHFDSQSDLGVKERAYVVMGRQVLDELFVAQSEFVGFLGKGDSGRVDDGKVVSKDLHDLNAAHAVRSLPHLNYSCRRV